MKLLQMNNPKVAFFTTYRGKHTDAQNFVTHKWVSELFIRQGVPHVAVVLNNKGKKFSGYMVEVEDPATEELIKNICITNGQTNYMVSNNDRTDTRLVYVDSGSSIRVGTLQMLPNFVASRCKASIELPNSKHSFVITNLER